MLKVTSGQPTSEPSQSTGGPKCRGTGEVLASAWPRDLRSHSPESDVLSEVTARSRHSLGHLTALKRLASAVRFRPWSTQNKALSGDQRAKVSVNRTITEHRQPTFALSAIPSNCFQISRAVLPVRAICSRPSFA